MNKAFVGLICIAAVGAFGCSESSGTGGTGGSGGMGGEPIIGPLTWTAPGLTVVGDECDFFLDEPYTFEMTIQGSNIILEDADPQSDLFVAADDYSPEQDEVLLTAQVNNTNFPPCVVELDDAFELVLSDPDVSIDLNDTVEVTWNHVETDVSDMVGDCEGEWFVPLPCAGEATLTLTQEIE